MVAIGAIVIAIGIAAGMAISVGVRVLSDRGPRIKGMAVWGPIGHVIGTMSR